MNETAAVSVEGYHVKLVGVLATAAGKRGLYIQAPPGLSLSDLIFRLVIEVNNPQFKDFLIDSATNNPLPNVIILLNEQDCNLFEGLRTKLDAGTIITLIPVAHGG